MEETFIKSHVYEFKVIDLLEASNGKKYIALQRGTRDTYRVNPFPFQEELENLPQTIKCRVKDINVMNGLPYLEQDMHSLLTSLFVPMEVYPFKVVSTAEQDKNSKTYYRVKDDYGIIHNYYTATDDKLDLNDIFSAEIREINAAGYLKFEYRLKNNLISNTPQNSDIDKINQSTNSDFGREDSRTEFKSSIVYKAGTIEPDVDKQISVIIKTIAGFMNAEGGILYIGVNDNGCITGINNDLQHIVKADSQGYTYQSTTDGYELRIRNEVKNQIGDFHNGELQFTFAKNENNDVYCAIQIPSIARPVYVNDTRLFQRAGNQTQYLKGEDITLFIEKRLSLGLNANTQPTVVEPKLESGSIVIEKGSDNLIYPDKAPINETTALEKVWKYFTWYSSGEWSFQSTKSKDSDVIQEIRIYPSQKDSRLLMCYNNGHINAVIPKKITKDKTSGKRYKNGWYNEAIFLNAYIAQSYDLIAAYSKDNDEVDMIKIHGVDHFNPNDSIQSMGPMIVNPKYGKVIKYKLIGIENKQAVAGLLEIKARTFSSLGVRLSSRIHKGEIDALEKM